MPVTQRKEIAPGTTVDVVQKQDQPTGRLTRGVVKDVLTNSSNHPRGIKVRLQDGRVGRVQAIVSRPDVKQPASPKGVQSQKLAKQGNPT
ncbi:MAG: YwbE family protein [Candidatus Lokiarchaeota archaeon]|nr:YwbE family protein [Candidatus Lokiarchaeota archaeon]